MDAACWPVGESAACCDWILALKLQLARLAHIRPRACVSGACTDFVHSALQNYEKCVLDAQALAGRMKRRTFA